MHTHSKPQNPFTSFQAISAIEFFSPCGRHVENCSPNERPMLARILFRETLRYGGGSPETVMNNCGDGIVLVLLTTGLTLDAVPTDYTIDEETLTLTFYQHKEGENRLLHYSVLTGILLVLFRELHSHWQVSQDETVPEYEEAFILRYPNGRVT
jgi:hypothetical protein